MLIFDYYKIFTDNILLFTVSSLRILGARLGRIRGNNALLHTAPRVKHRVMEVKMECMTALIRIASFTVHYPKRRGPHHLKRSLLCTIFFLRRVRVLLFCVRLDTTKAKFHVRRVWGSASTVEDEAV